LALKLEPLIAAKAKENQKLSPGRNGKGSLNSTDLFDTRKELGKVARVGSDTIYKAKVIAERAPGPARTCECT
jgi:hypothetical protein